ncbi:hypothetical protein PV371_08265 [Streptomyces sp. TX20-6-3]|uniref:hypothetical protein n=1 Tax=Streptomyces sp. TX20-6-3 TaxID=3028705 RepID=UPI0029A35F0A|nr:hypothetical protein [Streptomyces sp. TX20-6-3]MDX2559640.1 hypothetical protein [Streptomyces sp. TX20-6-3]
MSTAGFTLRHTDPEAASRWLAPAPSWGGTIPGLGFVELRYGNAVGRGDSFAQFSVAGERLPQGVFSGIRFGRAPLPARARFQVGEHTGTLSRRRSGLSRDGRALRIGLAGRAYRYRRGQDKRVHELLRQGIVVRITRDDWNRPVTLDVRTEGQVDAVDLSLALLLQGVYTRHLAQGGRWYSLPGRILNRTPDIF